MADELKVFNAQTDQAKENQLKALEDYYAGDSPDPAKAPTGPATSVVNSLVEMASSGLYEPALSVSNDSVPAGNQTTYVVRFLADTGVLEEKATALNLTTEQYGMLREEAKTNPVGAWWLAPIGVLNHTVLSGDENGDRDAAVIFGLFLFLMIAFPFIPWVNEIPEKLRMYKLFQR
jgi:hypothetical protein